ncbi:MAG: hypothetical protein AAFY76_07860 [Cyanobacteria bacterium J06649_11]
MPGVSPGSLTLVAHATRTRLVVVQSGGIRHNPNKDIALSPLLTALGRSYGDVR